MASLPQQGLGNPFSHIERRLAIRKKKLGASASSPHLLALSVPADSGYSSDSPQARLQVTERSSTNALIPVRRTREAPASLTVLPEDSTNLVGDSVPSTPTSNPHAATVSFLEPFYERVSGFCPDQPDVRENQNVRDSMTYGEVTWTGMGACYRAMGPLSEDDVFYDLGSGIGKFVAYVAMRGRVRRSVGLEVGAKRHETAVEVGDKICKAAEKKARSFKFAPSDFCFEQKDISRANYPSDLSIAFLSNLVMDTQLQMRTLDRLFKCCPKLRMVVAIIPIHHCRLKLVRAAHVGCTWAKVSSWQIYKVLGEELRPTLLRSRLRNS